MAFDLLESTKPSESIRVINFEDAQVVPGIVRDTYFLIVAGEAPCQNMKIILTPLIYTRQPEYWGIEVVGSIVGDICLEAVKPYSEAIPLAGSTGTKGIEVIGANQTKRFDVP